MERTLDPARLGDHLDRLYRAAWALCGSREDAEDLVQETFARLLARPRWLRNEDDIGYLLRALRNTCSSSGVALGGRLARYPIRDTRPCATAAGPSAAASEPPPTSVMNVRRLIRSPRWRSIAA